MANLGALFFAVNQAQGPPLCDSLQLCKCPMDNIICLQRLDTKCDSSVKVKVNIIIIVSEAEAT